MGEGTLKYPEHGYYHNNEDCWWTILVEGPIIIKFNKMDLETSYDWVAVWRREAYSNYTGHRIPPDLHVNGPVGIWFQSDSSGVDSGFSVSIVKESPITTPSPTQRYIKDYTHFFKKECTLFDKKPVQL